MPWVEPYHELKVQLLNDRNIFPWLTLDELWYDCPTTGKLYKVRKYFRTDGASVPKALLLVPVAGPVLFQRYFGAGVWQGFKEGVLHDALRRKDARTGETPVPAAEAHEAFRCALEEGGYPLDLVNTYYDAVRQFNS